MYDSKEKEGTKRRHQVDTVVEGIGINRLTHNFELALPIIDDAIRVSDAEAVAMSRFLVLNDGLFLGSSSAINLFACVKLVKQMGWNSGQRVVTILCVHPSALLVKRLPDKLWCSGVTQGVDITPNSGVYSSSLSSSYVA